MTQTAALLKAKHRLVRESQPENLRVRVHRALSWLARAEQEPDDGDARFLFLWIALNAAYASEFGFEQSERERAHAFVVKLLARDSAGRLQQAVHGQFTGPIRTLIDNPFVFEPFWKAMREHDGSNQWKSSFAAAKRAALQALMERKTDVVLSIVLDRLHVLRNQLVHGGATWNGSANRTQVKDGAAILGTILPLILDLLIEDRTEDFGGIAYPPVGR